MVVENFPKDQIFFKATQKQGNPGVNCVILNSCLQRGENNCDSNKGMKR